MNKGEVTTAAASGSLRLIGILLRTIAAVLALVLIIIAAATLGLIRSNETLVDVVVNADEDDDTAVSLLYLVANTQSSAGWLIFLSVGVIIAEGIAIGLFAANLGSGTARTVLDVFEIIFSFIVMFCYGATGIACATYARAWAEPPEECVSNDRLKADGGCSEKAFTATTSLETAFSFIQAIVFSVIGGFIIYNMVLRRRQ